MFVDGKGGCGLRKGGGGWIRGGSGGDCLERKGKGDLT